MVKAVDDTNRACTDPQPVSSARDLNLRAYQIDCIQLHYKRIAAQIPSNGDYRDVKAALENASRELEKIVVANQDRSAAVLDIRERGKPEAPVAGSVRAIKADRLNAANRAAAAIIQETALVILRSGEIPTRRNIHYASIAKAVTSNLVVLRSA